MAEKPWEKFQKPPSGGVESGPWSNYETKKSPEIIEEMHPDVSAWTRLVAKNLQVTPEGVSKYVQTQYPDLEVLSQEGRTLIRKPGEEAYRVLDPDTGFFSKDFLYDVGDIGIDAAQSVATTAAQAGAGLAGGLATGGWGAVPAAMAAGAGTEFLGESARQALAKYAGVTNEFDPTQIGIATAAGGLSPAIFGTGVAAKKAIQEGVKQGVQKGLPKYVALQEAKNMAAQQSGLPMRAIRSIAPRVGEIVSGVDRNILKSYANNFDAVKALEKTGVTPLARETGESLTKAIRTERQKIGQQLNRVISGSDEAIDIRPAKAVIKSKIAELSEKSLGTPSEKAQLTELRNLYDEFFTLEIKVPAKAASSVLDPTGKPVEGAVKASVKKIDIPDFLDAETALELQMRLKDPANLSRVSQGSLLARNQGKALGDQAIENTAMGAVSELSDQIDNTIESSIAGKLDEISDLSGDLTPRQLKDQYRRWSQISRTLKNKFSGPNQTYRTLSGLEAPTKDVERELVGSLDQELGTNALDVAKVFQAHKIFNNPSFAAISSKGGTSTSRSVPAALAGAAIGGPAGYYAASGEGGHGTGVAGGAIGSLLGGGLGVLLGSPASMRFYIQQLRNAREFGGTPLPLGVPGTRGQAIRAGAVLPSWKLLLDETQGE